MNRQDTQPTNQEKKDQYANIKQYKQLQQPIINKAIQITKKDGESAPDQSQGGFLCQVVEFYQFEVELVAKILLLPLKSCYHFSIRYVRSKIIVLVRGQIEKKRERKEYNLVAEWSSRL